MRVIAGVARGHPLKAARSNNLRPTSDLVRGAIFNMIGPYFDPETRVLDLYAGTGAMGIEALSRGASWADFVEQEAKFCAVIQDNLQHTGLAAAGKVHPTTVVRALGELEGPYDLVFMDPPYAQPVDPAIIKRLVAGELLALDGLLVLERSARNAEEIAFSALELVKSRRHGDTLVRVFTHVGRAHG